MKFCGCFETMLSKSVKFETILSEKINFQLFNVVKTEWEKRTKKLLKGSMYILISFH